MSRAAAAFAALSLMTLIVSGCETTQDESAQIGRRLGHQTANPGTTTIGATNASVKIVRSVLVAGSPGAVALELANTSAAAQTQIPVLIDVRDAKGATVYSNDTKGIEPSIQQLALLPAHATQWWVDNEILASGGTPSSVTARIGASTAPASASPPSFAATAISASDSFPGPHVSLTIHNHSSSSQSQIAIYAVALRAGNVVGAGRGVVPSLAGGAASATLVSMTGDVTAAQIQLTIVPGAAS